MLRKEKNECNVPLFSLEQLANLLDAVKDSLPRMRMFRAKPRVSGTLLSRCVVLPSPSFENRLHFAVGPCSRFPLWMQIHPDPATLVLSMGEAQVLPQKQLWQLWFKWLTGNHSAGGWWQRINFDWMVVSSSPICIYSMVGPEPFSQSMVGARAPLGLFCGNLTTSGIL